MTDLDFAEGLRGEYADIHGATETLRMSGHGTLYNLMRHNFGNPIHPAKAWRGDIAYHNKCLGVCYGNVVLFVGNPTMLMGGEELPNGLIAEHILDIQHVFKVR